MRIAIVFDSPCAGWDHADHLERMEEELGPGHKGEPETEYQIAKALLDRGHEVVLLGVHDEPTYAVDYLRGHPVDCVFNAAEGFQQQDGLDYLLPALLEAEAHRYTGAPPLGLMITRNKAMSKKVLGHHGVLVPAFITYRIGENVVPETAPPFPCIVKPLRLDASLGISQASVVTDIDGLTERVGFVHSRFNDAAIAEQFIEGRELYVSVLGNGSDLQLLPTVELVFDKDKTKPEERIATRSAKWDDPYRARKGIKDVFARPISKVAQDRLEAACRTAYRVLWLRDYARFDVRLDAEDQVWMLEANANPFIAKGHDVANAAKKAGLDYVEFIDRIVTLARARYA